MNPRDPFDAIQPHKLDVAAFIDAEAEASGTVSLSQLPRLASSIAPEADVAAQQVHWHITGWLEPQRGGDPHRWLTVEAQTDLPWTCQRCLTAVTLPIEVSRDIRWVANEALAAELDAELEDDVLALARQVDVLSLIEDELIMEAPLVPRHDTCPVALKMSTDDPATVAAEDAAAIKPNPFAVLAGLKKGSVDKA
jgi:uncharacterized protein